MGKKKLIMIIMITVLLCITIIGCFIGWRVNIHNKNLKMAELKIEITNQISKYDPFIKYKTETYFNTDEITLVFQSDDYYTFDKYGVAIVGINIDEKTYKVKSMYMFGNKLISAEVEKMLKEKNKFME